MASRKEQKEQARAARLAKEQEVVAQAQRIRRFQIFGGVTVAAIIVIVVAIVVSSGGGGAKTVSTSTAKADYAQVKTLLQGIHQSGTVLGNPNAKITMTYYGDLECPICQEFTVTRGDFDEFIQDQVRPGKVKVDYRSFCTATCDDYSNGQTIFADQQTAAYAAGKQNLFWDYAELFYHEQQPEGSGYVNATWLKNLAEQIPRLNMSKWETDLKDPVLSDQVQSDMSEAAKLGLSGTPTLIMSGPKGSVQAHGPLENGEYTIPNYAELLSAVKTVS